MMRFMTKRDHQFKGFDDPVEIFRAGTHTDSQGRSGTWTEDDLDQIIANHSDATAAPAVIGHPATDDPAYGWVSHLERKGKSLFAHFKDVVPQFAEAVEKGRYRKRSVSIGNTPDGWRLLHVGWLGAKAPALDLAPMNYAQPADVADTFEFEADWQTPGMIARALRRLREFVLEQYGADAADRVMPDHDIDFLAEHADALRNRERERESSDAGADPAFTRFIPNGDRTVKQFTQAELDQARDEARRQADAEFARQQSTLQAQLDEARAERHRAEFAAELGTLLDAGKLTPAQAQGALEFMCSLAAAPQEFEFAAADGKAKDKKGQLDWFREFVQALPKQVEIGHRKDDAPPAAAARRFNAPSGAVVDSDRLSLHEQALEYAQAHRVPYIDAVLALEQQEA